MPFYFKKKNKKVVARKVINPETGEKETKLVSETYFSYIGVVSPFKPDYMIMETDKPKESIHHTKEEVDRVRAILYKNGISFRLYDATTKQLLEPIIVKD